MSRVQDLEDFLTAAGLQNAERHPLQGDASSRSYTRLLKNGASAMLMDAPPDTCGSIAPFLTIGQTLRDRGLAAPEIYASDQTTGFIVMEDFGDALLARVCQDAPQESDALYRRAVDVLVHLYRSPRPHAVVEVGPAQLAEMIDPVFSHYAPSISKPEADSAKTALRDMLERLEPLPTTLAMRDYHAENIVLRDGQTGISSMGLLDFQDAIVTHPAYDLASLLQDARREIEPAFEDRMMTYFIKQTDVSDAAFRKGYAAIALQRNLRILGIFVRLAETRNKPHYLHHLPRLWRYISRTLNSDTLSELRPAFACLPAPEDR